MADTVIATFISVFEMVTRDLKLVMLLNKSFDTPKFLEALSNSTPIGDPSIPRYNTKSPISFGVVPAFQEND